MGGSEIMIMYIIMVDGIMLPEIMLAKGRWINDDQMGIKKELSQEKKKLLFSIVHRCFIGIFIMFVIVPT